MPRAGTSQTLTPEQLVGITQTATVSVCIRQNLLPHHLPVRPHNAETGPTALASTTAAPVLIMEACQNGFDRKGGLDCLTEQQKAAWKNAMWTALAY